MQIKKISTAQSDGHTPGLHHNDGQSLSSTIQEQPENDGEPSLNDDNQITCVAEVYEYQFTNIDD